MKKLKLFHWRIPALLAAVFSVSPVWAQDAVAATTAESSITSEVLFWVLLAVVVILLYVIYALSEMIIWGVKRKMEQRSKGGALMALLAIGFTMVGMPSVQAQVTAATATAGNVFWSDPYLPFYILITLEVIVIAWLSVILFNMLQPEKQYEPEVAKVSVLTAIWNKLNPTVAIEEEDSIRLEDHEYDGIVELGNKMPPWLQFLFYVTILFAVVYTPYYFLGYGRTMDEKFQDELAEAELAKMERLKSGMALVDENSVELIQTADVLSAGKQVFDKFCAACHGTLGEGGTGPNFTDEYWLHGGSIKDIFKTVKYGVPANGMAAWEGIITPKEMSEVSNYIKSLRGTNPPNAKEPQGVVWVEEVNSDAPADSTGAVAADTSKAVAVN